MSKERIFKQPETASTQMRAYDFLGAIIHPAQVIKLAGELLGRLLPPYTVWK
jgi:hypothetical protein